MKKLISNLKKYILVLLVIFVISTYNSVFAAEFQGVSIYPKDYSSEVPMSSSWFIYNLLPGESKKDTVSLRNDSNKEVEVKIYAVDGTTTSDGAFALNEEIDSKVEIGSWINLEMEKVAIPPNKIVDVPFIISIPKDAPVGDHLGGIVIENLELSKFPGINVKTRVGVRIYQTVPGDLVKKLELTKIDWQKKKGGFLEDKLFINFYLKNNGNVKVEPKAMININGNISNYDLRMILPSKPVVIPYQINKLPFFGNLQVKIEINYGDLPSEKLIYESSFFYFSRRSIVIISIIVLIFLFFIASRKKRKK